LRELKSDAFCPGSDFARQRRWVRKRKVNSQAVTETSTGSDGLPSLANRSVLTAVLTLHNRTDRIVYVAQYEPMPSVDNTWRLRSALFPIGSGETQALQVLLSSRPRVVASVDDSHLPSVVGAQDFDSLVNVDLPEVNASKPVHATPTPVVASTQAAGSSASPVSPRQAQPLSPRQSMSALISPRQQAAGQNAEHMEYYFVLGRTHSRLKALSPVKFSVRVDFWNGVRQKARKELGKSAAARHLHDTAAVRPFTSLHPFETEYVANRRTRVVKPALERLLGMQLEDDEVPTIGFTYSGGGVRAFVTSIGFTHAAIEMGLYDCVSYSGGVSGGSWFQAIWMASRRKFCNVVRPASMVTAFTDKLKKSVADDDADAKGNAASVTTATPAAIASPRRPHNRNSSHGSSNALENFIDDGAKVIDDAVAAAAAALAGAADSFLVVVRNRIAKRPFVHGRAGTSAVYDLILRTCAFRPDHDLSMADVYGGMLGYQWLKEHAKQRLFTVISDQLTLDQPFKPFPIYNAVRPKPAANGGDEPKKDASPLGYQWFEFTPCEVASLQHQAAIPVWAFGRQFDHGKSVSFAPEQSLAVLMGMFGSAFCATIEETNKVVSIPKQLYAMLHALGFSQSRLIKPVMNYNFLYRYKPTSATASTAAADAKADDDGKQAHDTAAANQNPAEDEVFREKHLSLMDAGILVNASLPSFFVPHRQMDIAFVFDARPSGMLTCIQYGASAFVLIDNVCLLFLCDVQSPMWMTPNSCYARSCSTLKRTMSPLLPSVWPALVSIPSMCSRLQLKRSAPEQPCLQSCICRW